MSYGTAFAEFARMSQDYDKVLAQRMVEESPTVNNLANLLAEILQRLLRQGKRSFLLRAPVDGVSGKAVAGCW